MMIWLYLHFPQLLLDTLSSDNVVTGPLAILTPTDRLVCQANQKARDTGVLPGTGLATASALCRSLTIFDYVPSKETKRLHALASTLYNLTSDIHLHPPNGLICKVSPMLLLYGSVEHYLDNILEHLKSQNVNVNYCISHYPETTKYLAQAGENSIIDDPAISLSRLKTLSIRQIGLSNSQLSKLEKMGVNTVKKILELPLKALGQRLGQELTNTLRALSSKSLTTGNLFIPPENFIRNVELLYEIDNSQALLFPIKRVLNELNAFLKLRDVFASSVLIKLESAESTETNVYLTSATPCQKAELWWHLAQIKCDQIKIDSPIRKITLVADTLTPAQHVNLDLFDPVETKQDPRELVSLLQAKLGDEAVFSLSFDAQHKPEDTVVKTPPLQSFNPLPENESLMFRPVIMHETPYPLDCKPNIIGEPERICHGWWQHEHVERDYYVALKPNGQILWVFKDNNGQWFQHGLFS
ncbi:Y-family DNA polymerase [Veronia pacifica]|uniref:UmuC domain-containing protein n=1 Tax=Veronia pacifica TaxID=1080227 RepID=A0A1C3EIM1_9GAMM|nr:DNA polymerase Y family protein [Veronia pacifica]ODA33096.1 hypothetical protein A8L45_11705 [Veronia pacifica]